MTYDWSKHRAWLVGLAMVIAAILAGLVVVRWSYLGHRPLDLNESNRIAICTADVLQGLRPPAPTVDLALIAQVRYLCYRQVFDEDSLTDWGLRKNAYLNQELQTVVIMWMVVAITLSGVFLAGLQLLAAYRLASAGKTAFEQGGQLNVEHNKISLSSSVTGLMILVVSFAFFLVYVTKVYLIQESKSTTPTSLESSTLATMPPQQPLSAANRQSVPPSATPCQPTAVAFQGVLPQKQQPTALSSKGRTTGGAVRPRVPPTSPALAPKPN
jgi:hypothetical protein